MSRIACLAAVLVLAALTGCGSLRGLMPAGPAVLEPAPPAAPMQWGDPPVGARSLASTTASPIAAPTAASIPATRTDPAYLIGPEDGLEISVWKDDTLKATTLVRPDGGISFPLAGDLQAAGKTVAQLRDELVKRLEKFIPEPVVSVSVVRVASYRVYVLGRVNKPGEFGAGRVVDVLQALTLAGGVTPFAVEDEIRIIRREQGRSVSIPFDYAKLRKSGDLSQNITLQSGDVVFVP